MASIQGIYVALFGRPADPRGLEFFNEATNEGADLTAIGDLAATDEYQDRFEGMSNAQIVNSIYLSLFNRPAEAAGLEFFSAALNNGTLNINNIAIAILDGAQGADLATVNNKIAAADLFTAALDTETEIALYTGDNAITIGQQFLAGVTSNAATVPSASDADAAVEELAEVSFEGNTVALAAGGTDDVTVGALDDTAATQTTVYNDTIDATVSGTFATGDKINGGAGTDTLNAVIAASVTPAEGAVKSVEVFNIRVNNAAGATLNVAEVAGLTQVWHDGTLTSAAPGDLTVTEIAEGVTVGVRGDAGADSAFTFDGADNATLVLEEADGGDAITIDGVDEVLTVNIDGDATVSTFTTSSESIVFAGEGDLTVDVGSATGGVAGDVLESVDASGLDGSIDLGVTDDVAAELTIRGTSSADIIDLSTAGVSEETIVFAEDEASTYASFESIIGFDGGASGDVLDFSEFGFANDGVHTFANLVASASFGGESVAVYDDGTNTYVFADTNGNGSLDLASDFAVQLTGTGLGLTADNFNFA